MWSVHLLRQLNFIRSRQVSIGSTDESAFSVHSHSHSLLTTTFDLALFFFLTTSRASKNRRLHYASPESSSRVSGSVVRCSPHPVGRGHLKIVAQVLTLSCLTESFSFSARNCCCTPGLHEQLYIMPWMAWIQTHTRPKYVLSCLVCSFNPDILALVSPFIALSCSIVFNIARIAVMRHVTWRWCRCSSSKLHRTFCEQRDCNKVWGLDDPLVTTVAPWRKSNASAARLPSLTLAEPGPIHKLQTTWELLTCTNVCCSICCWVQGKSGVEFQRWWSVAVWHQQTFQVFYFGLHPTSNCVCMEAIL